MSFHGVSEATDVLNGYFTQCVCYVATLDLATRNATVVISYDMK